MVSSSGSRVEGVVASMELVPGAIVVVGATAVVDGCWGGAVVVLGSTVAEVQPTARSAMRRLRYRIPRM
jgi:hypothetical protein